MKNDFVPASVRSAFFVLLSAAFVLPVFVSCSKEAAPAAPMERSRVLLNLFARLERNDYAEALTNIESYRALDPTNLFLSDCEHLVRANSVIAEARTKLAADDIAGASSVLDAYVLRYGDVSKPVTTAKNQVDLLLQAQKLDQALLAAEFSEDLRAAALELKTFAAANVKLFPRLGTYAAAKIKSADTLAALERSDACAGIFQDALDARSIGRDSEAAALAALLELDAPAAEKNNFAVCLQKNGLNQ